MNHHNRSIRLFCDHEKSVDSLSLHGIRTYQRMIFRACSSLFFGFIDQSVDHSGIFTVNSGKAAALSQFFQNLIKITVIYDHGRISHVKLKACNPLIDHILDFFFRLLIPFYNGHMEGIVAGTFSVCLSMPFFQAFLQRMAALVLRGVINNQSCSTQNGCPCPCLKIICSYCSGNLKIKMRMPVNKAREKQFSGYVNNLCILCRQIFSYPDNLFTVYKNILIKYTGT